MYLIIFLSFFYLSNLILAFLRSDQVSSQEYTFSLGDKNHIQSDVLIIQRT